MSKEVFDTVKELLQKGELPRAIFELKRALSLDKTNLALKAKLAEVYAISGDSSNAIIIYSELAREYAGKGFLIQAIAANKKIMELDPDHLDTQKELAKLYAQKAKGVLQKEAPDQLKKEIVEELKEEVVPAKFPLFSDLSQDEFIEIVKRLKSKNFPAQSLVFKEGDSGDSIFLVASGKINIYKRDPSGKQVLLRTINEGDFFGEFSYFANAKRNVSAISASEVQLLELTRDEIDNMIENFQGVKNALVEFYKTRVLDSILGVTPVFRELPYVEREKFLPKFELVIIGQDNDIVTEGESGDAMFVIVSGAVEVWTKRSGKKIVLATLKEGDFFGEISLITGETRTATVTALKETRLMKLKKSDFDEISNKYPRVLEITKNILDKRLESTITTVISAEDKGLT
jgi:CRP-like cAMP-binding protein